LSDADFDKKDRSKIVGQTKEIDAINAEDIQAVAKKYLTKGYVLGVLYPEDKK